MNDDAVTLDAFHRSLSDDRPPVGLSVPLQALWWSGRGRWDHAHELAQSVDDSAGAWVHAHLHRIEGDAANAAYWYRRAGRDVCALPIEDERGVIAAALLGAPVDRSGA